MTVDSTPAMTVAPHARCEKMPTEPGSGAALAQDPVAVAAKAAADHVDRRGVRQTEPERADEHPHLPRGARTDQPEQVSSALSGRKCPRAGEP